MDLDALQEMEEAWEDGAAAEGTFKKRVSLIHVIDNKVMECL